MEVGDIVVSKEWGTMVEVVEISESGTFNGIVLNAVHPTLKKGVCVNNFISSCFKRINKKENKMDKKDWNFMVIDTETGGLDPKNHSLLSIGVVFVKEGEVVDKKEWFICRDEYKVTAGAMRINKFDFEDIYKHGMDLDSVGREILLGISKHFKSISSKPRVIGHNVGFDLGFIHNQLMSKEMWERHMSYRNIDTAAIANFLKDCGKLKVDRCGLSNLMEYFELGNEDSEGRHSALFDAENTFKVYEKMVELMEGN